MIILFKYKVHFLIQMIAYPSPRLRIVFPPCLQNPFNLKLVICFYVRPSHLQKVTTIVQFYCIIMHHLCLLMTQAVTQLAAPYRHSYTHMNSLCLWQNSTQAKWLSTQNNLQTPGYVLFFSFERILPLSIIINFLQK